MGGAAEFAPHSTSPRTPVLRFRGAPNRPDMIGQEVRFRKMSIWGDLEAGVGLRAKLDSPPAQSGGRKDGEPRNMYSREKNALSNLLDFSFLSSIGDSSGRFLRRWELSIRRFLDLPIRR